jgi:large subunit ribosomal protein L13
MKTFVPKVDPNNRQWWVVDLSDVIMGRCATQVATILRGKHRPTFTPHLDTGDHVVVVNAKSVKITGAHKPDQLAYYRYSGYPGGLKKTTFAEQMKKKPEDTFKLAVRRMLPKNRLGRKMLKKLHVYPGPDHPHSAQKPEKLEL